MAEIRGNAPVNKTITSSTLSLFASTTDNWMRIKRFSLREVRRAKLVYSGLKSRALQKLPMDPYIAMEIVRRDFMWLHTTQSLKVQVGNPASLRALGRSGYGTRPLHCNLASSI